MYNKGDFYTYLSGYRVEKGCEYTHTSITKPAGSFYIPSEKIDEYMDIYKQAYLANEDLYVTEKHRDICSILIDIDLRFDKDSKVRNYDPEFIVDILKIYCDKINNYVNIPDNLKIYVMEKSKPTIDKNFQKDGVHIIIPGVVTKPTIQYLVRQEILDDPRFDELYTKYNILNGKEDILDKAVIYKNNWQMYGSKKPQCEAYKITKVYTLNKDLSISLDSGDVEINHGDLIELMSIRNKYESTKIKIEKLPVIEEFDKKENSKKMHKNPALQANQNNKKNVITDSELELVEKLIDILDIKRSDSFDSWIRVGWCFRNIDNRLLDKWIEFSKKNVKFQEGECEKLWPYMKSDGLGMGTLHMWAKHDNEEKYRDICNKDLTLLFEKSTSETHTDIAKVVHYLYKYDYVCVCNAKNLWYEFRNHRWVSCDNAHTLKSRMSNEVVNEYRKKITYYNQKAIDDEANKDNYDNIVKKLVSISSKLKTVPFKNNIVAELRDLFYIDKFEEKLDSKCTLIGFENGVYDLEMAEFRDGRPDDYISFSTNINYIPYNPEHRNVIEMHEFVSKIFTVPALKQYVLTLLSSFLNGNIREEKFHIWTGSGCFAKGSQIMMFNGLNKNVEDVQIGDILMGDDSTPRNVKELFRGYSDMYKIIPVKGDSFVVNGGHDLVVKMSNGFRVSAKRSYFVTQWIEHDDKNAVKIIFKTSPTRELANQVLSEVKLSEKSVKNNDIIKLTVHQYLKLPKTIQILMSVYRPEMVNFEKKDITLDPYLLGYWLGDGNAREPSFTTEDHEIVEYIESLNKENDAEMNVYDDKGSAKTYGVRANKNITKINYFRKGLQDYNLFKNKHIPHDFKVNDRNTRLQTLAGIVDSDGHYQPRSKQVEITLKSEKLIDDTIWIARSLGLSCYKSKIKKKCCNNGTVGDYFRINMVGVNLCEIPCKIPRKKPSVRTCPRDPLKLSFKVERIEDNNFYGFELDGNNRFLMGDFVIQKNSNGKSKFIELFERSFGGYCVKFPITLLTQKRASSNSATSELARAKGKRFASLQEPSEDEKLNIGLMKEISGGDTIQARMLYKEPIEFKPQFKMILACNHLPSIPSDDGGTWRRIRVVEFTSKFCENPNPEIVNEFLMDKELSLRFDEWREYFMSMLIEYHKEYIKNGIKEPEEVLKCTREYQRSNDCYLDFVESELEKSPDNALNKGDAHTCFKLWVVDNAPIHFKNIVKKTFTTALYKILSKGVQNIAKLESWKGWAFKNKNIKVDDLDH